MLITIQGRFRGKLSQGWIFWINQILDCLVRRFYFTVLEVKIIKILGNTDWNDWINKLIYPNGNQYWNSWLNGYGIDGYNIRSQSENFIEKLKKLYRNTIIKKTSEDICGEYLNFWKIQKYSNPWNRDFIHY